MKWHDRTTHWQCDVCGFEARKVTKYPFNEDLSLPKESSLPMKGWTMWRSGHGTHVIVCPKHVITIDGKVFSEAEGWESHWKRSGFSCLECGAPCSEEGWHSLETGQVSVYGSFFGQACYLCDAHYDTKSGMPANCKKVSFHFPDSQEWCNVDDRQASGQSKEG